MDATTTVAIIEGLVADIGLVLFGGLTSVLGLIGFLIGLFFIVKLVRNYVSGAKS